MFQLVLPESLESGVMDTRPVHQNAEFYLPCFLVCITLSLGNFPGGMLWLDMGSVGALATPPNLQ